MRRVKQTIAFGILFLLADSSFAQDCAFRLDTASILASSNLKQLVDKISVDQFKEYKSVSGLPKTVFDNLKCLTKGFSIADKGQPFQDNCSPNQNLPVRQLDYLAVGRNSIILTYLTGGDGIEINILLLEYSKRGVKELWKTSSLDGITKPADIVAMYRGKTLFQNGIVRL